MSRFYAHRSQKTVISAVFFALLGSSMSVKAVRKMLMKSTPALNVHFRPRQTAKSATTTQARVDVQYEVSLEEGNDYEGQHPALKKYGTFNNNNNNNYDNGNQR